MIHYITIYNVNKNNSQQRRKVNRFGNKNQNQFQIQKPKNNKNMNNFILIQNINNLNNNNSNYDVNNIDFNRETHNGDSNIPSLIEYSNSPQNINIEGEQKNNENLDEKIMIISIMIIINHEKPYYKYKY